MAGSARCTASEPDAVAIRCRSCPVVGAQVWGRGLEDAHVALEDAKSVARQPRRSWLFHQGDEVQALYALIEGAVVVSRSDGHGEPVAVHLVTPGMTLGFRGLMEGGCHKVSAQCATACVVCTIPVAAAEAALADNRALEGVFFHHLADELQHCQDRMLQMTALGVRDRMVLLLGQLARHFSSPVEGGGLLIATPISRADMGALAGMTPETVSRCIRTVQSENLAHFTRRHILIPCRERFCRELARLGGE